MTPAESRVLDAAVRWAGLRDRLRAIKAEISQTERERRCERIRGPASETPIVACWAEGADEEDGDEVNSVPAWKHQQHLAQTGSFFSERFGYCGECARVVDLWRERRALCAQNGARTQALKRSALTLAKERWVTSAPKEIA